MQTDALPGDHASVVVCQMTSDFSNAADFRVTIEPTDANGLRMRSRIMADKPVTISRERIDKPSPNQQPTGEKPCCAKRWRTACFAGNASGFGMSWLRTNTKNSDKATKVVRLSKDALQISLDLPRGTWRGSSLAAMKRSGIAVQWSALLAHFGFDNSL